MAKGGPNMSAKSTKKSDPKKRRKKRVETFNSYIYKVRAGAGVQRCCVETKVGSDPTVVLAFWLIRIPNTDPHRRHCAQQTPQY